MTELDLAAGLAGICAAAVAVLAGMARLERQARARGLADAAAAHRSFVARVERAGCDENRSRAPVPRRT